MLWQLHDKCNYSVGHFYCVLEKFISFFFTQTFAVRIQCLCFFSSAPPLFCIYFLSTFATFYLVVMASRRSHFARLQIHLFETLIPCTFFVCKKKRSATKSLKKQRI